MLTPGRLFYCPETERGEGFTLVGSRIYAKKNGIHLRGVRMYALGVNALWRRQRHLRVVKCNLKRSNKHQGSQMHPEGVK